MCSPLRSRPGADRGGHGHGQAHKSSQGFVSREERKHDSGSSSDLEESWEVFFRDLVDEDCPVICRRFGIWRSTRKPDPEEDLKEVATCSASELIRRALTHRADRCGARGAEEQQSLRRPPVSLGRSIELGQQAHSEQGDRSSSPLRTQL